MPTGWLHISHHRPSLRSRLSNYKYADLRIPLRNSKGRRRTTS